MAAVFYLGAIAEAAVSQRGHSYLDRCVFFETKERWSEDRRRDFGLRTNPTSSSTRKKKMGTV